MSKCTSPACVRYSTCFFPDKCCEKNKPADAAGHHPMKLYEVPSNTYVKVLEAEVPPPGALAVDVGQIIYFSHIDGMYSYCKDIDGNIVHLKAWTEVEIVNRWLNV